MRSCISASHNPPVRPRRCSHNDELTRNPVPSTPASNPAVPSSHGDRPSIDKPGRPTARPATAGHPEHATEPATTKYPSGFRPLIPDHPGIAGLVRESVAIAGTQIPSHIPVRSGRPCSKSSCPEFVECDLPWRSRLSECQTLPDYDSRLARSIDRWCETRAPMADQLCPTKCSSELLRFPNPENGMISFQPAESAHRRSRQRIMCPRSAALRPNVAVESPVPRPVDQSLSPDNRLDRLPEA